MPSLGGLSYVAAMRLAPWLSLCVLAASCGREPLTADPDAGAALDERDAGVVDAGLEDADAGLDAGIDAGVGAALDAGPTMSADAGLGIDGIVFVHGINGSLNDWNTMVDRFKSDGWPADRLIARTYSDPSWGCNGTNATQLSVWIQDLAGRGATRIAIVAHSMGGLSSRHYLQRLGGTSSVEVFITLGTMHHGLSNPCLSPLPVCVWQELCQSGPFITGLNSPPATPGPTKWVSIFSTGDTTVPVTSAQLTGAQNIQLTGLTHDGVNGLQNSPLVYQHVKDSM